MGASQSAREIIADESARELRHLYVMRVDGHDRAAQECEMIFGVDNAFRVVGSCPSRQMRCCSERCNFEADLLTLPLLSAQVPLMKAVEFLMCRVQEDNGCRASRMYFRWDSEFMPQAARDADDNTMYIVGAGRCTNDAEDRGYHSEP